MRLGPTGRKPDHPIQQFSTDELFKMRDEKEKAEKELSEAYCGKLRKRSPVKISDKTRFLDPEADEGEKRREFFRQSRKG